MGSFVQYASIIFTEIVDISNETSEWIWIYPMLNFINSIIIFLQVQTVQTVLMISCYVGDVCHRIFVVHEGNTQVAFNPLGAISRRDVAARWTLKMGYKEMNRVVYTGHDVAGRHNGAPPEMSPAPILSRRSTTSPQIL